MLPGLVETMLAEAGLTEGQQQEADESAESTEPIAVPPRFEPQGTAPYFDPQLDFAIETLTV